MSLEGKWKGRRRKGCYRMREIKFRIWNPTLESMAMVEKVEYLGFTGILHNNIGHKEGKWMQYTGLKDCNGKEVFEGDIVASEKYKGSVQYSNGYLDYRVYTTPEHCYFRLSELQPIEVVGNVFEHPHLLAMEEK